MKDTKMSTVLRRKLDAEDLRRMNLPDEFWRTRVDQVSEKTRPAVARYLLNVDRMSQDGIGLFVTGKRGVGKSAVAALIAKEARARGFTAYFTSLWELREMIRARIMFDDETTMLRRCQEVDFLVLDGFREEDAQEKWFGLKEVEELIRNRGNKRLVTIITTRLSFVDMKKAPFKSLLEASQGHLVQFPVEGPNRHAERQDDLRRVVFGE